MYSFLAFISLLSILPTSHATPITGAPKSPLQGFFLTEYGCTCKQSHTPGILYSGILPHTPVSTSVPENLPTNNISLGVAGPPYVWSSPGSYLETRSLGIDTLRHKLYVGLQYNAEDDSRIDGIFSVNYDGSNRTKIVNRNTSSVGGVAIASRKGRIYYSEGWDFGFSSGNDTRLRSANLDGTDIKTVIDMNKMECRLANSTDPACPPRVYALEKVFLDDEEEYVYWTTANAAIQRGPGIWRARTEIPVNQAWENRTDIEYLPNCTSPAQFRLVDEYIYCADMGRNATGNVTYPYTSPVYRQSLLGGVNGEVELVLNVPLRVYERVRGIAVDAMSREIWVLVHNDMAEVTIWRFDGSGSGSPFQLRNGERVFSITGFEVF